MWADAQRNDRRAEYRWRPLFNAAVWLTPTTRDAKPVEICWGCPKLPNGSQSLVGRSSPYFEDVWGKYYV